jgi:Sec-independent protein translocase protein TatA
MNIIVLLLLLLVGLLLFGKNKTGRAWNAIWA